MNDHEHESDRERAEIQNIRENVVLVGETNEEWLCVPEDMAVEVGDMR